MNDNGKSTYLTKEDYEEPRCVLCMDAPGGEKVTRIDVGRMMSKLDEHLAYEDYESAERHLSYWLGEAQVGNDEEGLLIIYNEMMGLYRKMNKPDKTLESAEKAVTLAEKLQLDGTEIYGTTYLNAATAMKFVGKPEVSIGYFEKALAAYEKRVEKSDPKFAGLYNNMALTLVDLKRFDEAEDYYGKALEIMKSVKNGGLDMASTYLNSASLYEAKDGLEDGAEKINECLEKAEACLNDESLEKNSYYYFVCDKCASGFRYYGWFMLADELDSRVREYHERA